MRPWLPIATAACLALFCEPTLAQTKPEVGSQAKPFKVFGITGQFDGKEV